MPIVPSLLLLGAAGIVHAARKSPRHRHRVAIATIAVLAY